jgi:hypothetical protein
VKDNGIMSGVPYEEQYTKMMEDPTGKPDPLMDLMLTSQYLFYAEKVVQGLSSEEVKKIEWYVPRKKTDFTSLLDSMLSGKKIQTSELIFPQYFKLQEKLKLYHEIEEKEVGLSYILTVRNTSWEIPHL